MRRRALIIGLMTVPTLLGIALYAVHLCGWVRPFAVPNGGMTPAISAGDRIIMEKLTPRSRKPQRGDVVVFKTEGIAALGSSTIFIMRIAGLPGEQVKISEGRLMINNQEVTLRNAEGPIAYTDVPPAQNPLPLQSGVTVPAECFFMLGDNSANSYDSRYWGYVPSDNMLGKVSFCYWPPERAGEVQ